MTDGMTWQPIETAPKDVGVLLTDGGHIVALGAWHDGIWLFWEGDAGSILTLEEFDRDHTAHLNSWVNGFGPTHWMPLPPPPADQEE